MRRVDPVNRVGPVDRVGPLRIYIVSFDYMASELTRLAGIPVAASRVNSLRRVENFTFNFPHVIAFCRVGPAKRVEKLLKSSRYAFVSLANVDNLGRKGT